MDPWQLKPARDLDLPLGERILSHRRESGLLQTAMHKSWWSAVRAYMAVMHRLRVQGRERVPRNPPFVLAANHSSHLDALVLASALGWRLWDRVYSIAAGDTFFATRFQAAFSSFALNALPMWRKSRGLTNLQTLRERLLEDGCGFILFPEGTRSRDGQMQRFKPGIGMLVAGSDVPVIPCYLEGTFAALAPRQWIPRPRQISLHVGSPLSFADTSNDRTGWLEVARQTEDAVRALGGTSNGVMP